MAYPALPRRGGFPVLLTVTLVAWLAQGGLARAQTAREVARDRTRQATSAYDLGQFEKAAHLYEQAYEAVPEPSLLYNIGQSYRKAEQPEKALTAYQSFLRKAPKDSPMRPQVEARAAELEKIVADTRETRNAPPADTLASSTPDDGGKDTAPSPPPAVDPGVRTGWIFGIGVGVGSLRAECDTCGDAGVAGGLHGHIGYMLRPKLAILLDLWGMGHTEDELTVYQNIGVIAARYWFTPALWAQGGLGSAQAGYKWSGVVTLKDRTETVFGVMFAGGYEFYRRGHWVIDGQLRYGTGFYSGEEQDSYVVKAHSLSIGAALSWY